MHLSKFIIVVVLCALTFISVYVHSYDYSGLLLIAPERNITGGVGTEQLEEISGLVTYGIGSQGMAKGVKASYSVNLVKTNDIYPFIMNYPLIDGSFFTKEAFENQKKTVCLNRKAAFEIFGDINITGVSIEINDTAYVITGVIDDKATENLNIYMPLNDERTNIFLVRTDNKDLTQNEFKQIGIVEGSYVFVDLALLQRAIVEKATVAFVIFVILLVVMAVNKRFFTIASCFALISWLFTRYTGTFLSWKLNAPLLQNLDSGCFQKEVKFLQQMELLSNIFILIFFAVVIIMIFQATIKYSQH